MTLFRQFLSHHATYKEAFQGEVIPSPTSPIGSHRVPSSSCSQRRAPCRSRQCSLSPSCSPAKAIRSAPFPLTRLLVKSIHRDPQAPCGNLGPGGDVPGHQGCALVSQRRMGTGDSERVQSGAGYALGPTDQTASVWHVNTMLPLVPVAALNDQDQCKEAPDSSRFMSSSILWRRTITSLAGANLHIACAAPCSTSPWPQRALRNVSRSQLMYRAW